MNSLYSQLASTVSINPQRPAVVGPNLVLSADELLQSAYSVASWLQQLGIGKGSQVAIRLTPETECVFLIALDSLGAVGAIVRSQDQIERLDTFGFDLLVVNRPLSSNARVKTEVIGPNTIPDLEVDENFEAYEWNPSETYRILFTSGTTGSSKAVAVSRRRFDLRVARARGGWLSLEPLMLLFGLDTGMAQFALANSIERGAPHLLPYSENSIASFLESWAVKSVMGSESQLLSLTQGRSEAMAGIERVLVGGSYPTEALFRAVELSFPNAKLFNVYGSAEAGQVFFGEISRGRRSLGEADEGVEVEIDSSGFASENEGLLVVRSEIVPTGYISDPEATAAHFTARGFVSGDIVMKDESGAFHFVGRADNLINLGGVKVNPEQIESYFEELFSGARGVVRLESGELELDYESNMELDDRLILSQLKEKFGSRAPSKTRRVASLKLTETGKKARN